MKNNRIRKFSIIPFFLSIISIFACHRNYIKRVDISDEQPYNQLINIEFFLQQDSYVFSALYVAADLCITNCGGDGWFGPKIDKMDISIENREVENILLRHFYPKGTPFVISNVMMEVTRLGCGGPQKKLVVEIDIGKDKLVLVDHNWVKEDIDEESIANCFDMNFVK